MIQHICGFGSEPRAVALHRFDYGLNRFLTELFGRLLGAFGEELCRPGAVGVGPLAVEDGGVEIIKRHGMCPGVGCVR